LKLSTISRYIKKKQRRKCLLPLRKRYANTIKKM
jgi:hypothetical protein